MTLIQVIHFYYRRTVTNKLLVYHCRIPTTDMTVQYVSQLNTTHTLVQLFSVYRSRTLTLWYNCLVCITVEHSPSGYNCLVCIAVEHSPSGTTVQCVSQQNTHPLVQLFSVYHSRTLTLWYNCLVCITVEHCLVYITEHSPSGTTVQCVSQQNTHPLVQLFSVYRSRTLTHWYNCLVCIAVEHSPTGTTVQCVSVEHSPTGTTVQCVSQQNTHPLVQLFSVYQQNTHPLVQLFSGYRSRTKTCPQF